MKTPKPLNFQSLTTLRDGNLNHLYTSRAKVPGGWLVAINGGVGFGGVTFYPDPEHKWDGASLD